MGLAVRGMKGFDYKYWLPQALTVAMLVVMVWQVQVTKQQAGQPAQQSPESAPLNATPPVSDSAESWVPDLSPYWPIGVMVILIVVNSTIATRHRRGASETARALALEKAKKPYPRVEIWRHAASSAQEADKIRDLLAKSGWEVDDSYSTNLSQHATGVTLCGGTSFSRNVATWGLQTLNLKAEIEQRNDPPLDLQVIIGALDPSKQIQTGHGIPERVRATQIGFYDNARRREGDVFTLSKASHFSERWMERVSPDTPEKVTTSAQALLQVEAGLRGRNPEEAEAMRRQDLGQALAQSRQEEAKLVGLANQLQNTIIERDTATQALAMCNKNSAFAELRWAAERATYRGAAVHVTVRFADYQDFELVEQIEVIFKAYTQWPVEIDGGNKPVIKPDPRFKVIIESGIENNFAALAHFFSYGSLINAPIGTRAADRTDHEHLVIEVLPTIKP